MSQFRLLKQTRQMTEYSCGASALQSVLSYWGREIEEEALMRLLGTNPEVGTFPEDMVRGARALGFDAEMKENATLDELKRFTAAGHPGDRAGAALEEREGHPGIGRRRMGLRALHRHPVGRCRLRLLPGSLHTDGQGLCAQVGIRRALASDHGRRQAGQVCRS